MELTEQQKQSLAEVELCIDRYFDMQVKPVMTSVQKELTAKQLHERAEYQSSWAGALTAAMNPNPLDGGLSTEIYLKTNGEWNSKTTEDYYEMCREKIQQTDTMGKDLGTLADLWRERIIQTIGKEAYDKHSQSLGTDMAVAYVGYRMESRMIGHLVDQRVPKSSAEYILRKGLDSSLFGFATGLQQTEMDHVLDSKAEKIYSPNMAEKGAGKVLGFGADVMMTGGIGSWASVGKLALTEAVLQGGEAIYELYLEGKESSSIESYISQGVFGSRTDVMTEIQQRSKQMDVDENPLSLKLNEQMEGRLYAMDAETRKRLFFGYDPKENPWKQFRESMDIPGERPYTIARAPELPEELKPKEVKPMPESASSYMAAHTETASQEHPQPIETEYAEERPINQNTSGWGGMLSSFGLNDMEGVGRNLGYIVAMLPDMMMGIFTGKTDALHLAKDNMLPLASILMGLFTRNPLLKLTLIGMGGMNLMNKVGHEALERKQIADGVSPQKQYRQYEDQPLNSRIKNPEIRGGMLFATVDGVPSTIQLPEKAVAAYETGALPLNTLANAVLAKSDAMNSAVRENYEASQNQKVQQRGIS